MLYTPKLDWTDTTKIRAVDYIRIETGIRDIDVEMATLKADVSNLRTRVNTLEATLPDSYLYNHFNDDLTTISSIRVIRGYYNEAQSRLEV